MIYTTKEDGKTILWGMTTDDKDDAYETVTDKNDVVIFRQVDTGKDFVYNDGDWYEFATSGGGGGGGTGGGVLICALDMQTMTLDKTWNEINSAPLAVIKMSPDESATSIAFVNEIEIVGGNSYKLDAFSMGGGSPSSVTFVATSADGYPVMNMG